MSEQEGHDALAEACARNTPVEVARRGRGTTEPPGRGRMIELNDEAVLLEEVQVIGREVRYGAGDLVDCYFNHAGALLHFRSTILDAGLPVRLNERMIVPGMRLTRPAEVLVGQRRNVYRVSLGARSDAPRASVWLARTIEDVVLRAVAQAADAEQGEDGQQQGGRPGMPPEPKPEPPRPNIAEILAKTPPDFEARVSDASDTGLGLAIYGGIYSRFKIFQHVWLSLTLPGASEPLILLGEIRQSRAIPELGARLGVLLIRDDTGGRHMAKIRRLVAYLTEVQRASRR